MPSWLLKSAVQRAISLLPASSRWNELFQKHVTRSLELTSERFDMRLSYCGRHLSHFSQAQPGRREFTVFELGTGWYPVVPVGMFLCGAADVWSYDIAPLVNRERLGAMFAKFLEHDSAGSLPKYLPGLMPERVTQMREVAARSASADPLALLEEMRIHVRVQDAQRTGLPGGSIDLFTSTGVLEYIPRFVLQAIMAECKRLGRGRAVQSHYLNLVDQYSYFDKSITAFNFLRYSPRAWAWLNSPLTWQNRLRIADYRQLFQEAGYRILLEENRSGAPEDLARVPLAPEFRHYRTEDLLVLFSWLVAESDAVKS